MAIDAYKRYRPKLGEEGERCTGCGVPLAEDQRYCLNCGVRRGNARIPFLDVLHAEWDARRAEEQHQVDQAAIDEAVAAAQAQQRNWKPLMSAAAGGLVALVVGLGFVIGQSGDDEPTAAAQPQVIQVGGGSSTTAAVATFAGDWPDGQTGWTVQLETLPKDTTQADAVAAAKTAAEGKGAAEVGALDADAFDGLEAAGSYVLYSGVFDDEKTAKKRLKEVEGDFPEAKVIEIGGGGGGDEDVVDDKPDPDALSGKKEEAAVSDDLLQDLSSGTPEENAKKSRRLPDTTVLPGKPPPKDNKTPGGGSDVETIE